MTSQDHLFAILEEKITHCSLCPRLVKFREETPPRKPFEEELYWRRPVAGFGDKDGWLLILGLAPSSQGANRTGRIFTGDPSASFLIEQLYEVGFANQPSSELANDGLALTGCYLTAAVKCVPPKHHPLASEITHCSRFLLQEISLLKNLQAILFLGEVAFRSFKQQASSLGYDLNSKHFGHGAVYRQTGLPTLYLSYHPSPQNTYTRKLTPSMFQLLLRRIISEYSDAHPVQFTQIQEF